VLPGQEITQPKTYRELEYERMIAQSKTFILFTTLSIPGFAEYNDGDKRAKIDYFSATQNGQYVFTIKSVDLMLAGYELRVLTECLVRIKYYDFEGLVTCCRFCSLWTATDKILAPR
jgi:hypothetical protein